MNEHEEAAEQLQEIQEQMLHLIREARQILRGIGGFTEKRAESYWIPHIKTALTNNHEFLSSSMVTMADTIEELQAATEDPD
jgi:hypothetical protein